MANINPDSEEDFLRMQQEAIRRVRDMQKRARLTLENAGMHIENTDSFPDDAQKTAIPDVKEAPAEPEHTAAHFDAPPHEKDSGFEHEKSENPPPQGNGQDSPLFGNFSLKQLSGFNLSLDSDQILLIFLIYLLATDGADKWLMLSLAYIMFS